MPDSEFSAVELSREQFGAGRREGNEGNRSCPGHCRPESCPPERADRYQVDAGGNFRFRSESYL